MVFQRRLRLGLPQAAVAAAASLSTGYYSEIENGKRPPPPRDTADRIAKALGLENTQVATLVAIAVAERAALRQDAGLSSDVRGLIFTIWKAAPHLSSELIAKIRLAIEECHM